MLRCMSCGEDLGWVGDFNLDEMFPEEALDEEGNIIDNGCVGIYQCGKCELEFHITTYENSDVIRIHAMEYEKEEE